LIDTGSIDVVWLGMTTGDNCGGFIVDSLRDMLVPSFALELVLAFVPDNACDLRFSRNRIGGGGGIIVILN